MDLNLSKTLNMSVLYPCNKNCFFRYPAVCFCNWCGSFVYLIFASHMHKTDEDRNIVDIAIIIKVRLNIYVILDGGLLVSHLASRRSIEISSLSSAAPIES